MIWWLITVSQKKILTRRIATSGFLASAAEMSLLSRLHQLVKSASQFVIATHSPILLAYPNATILQLDGDGMRHVEYEETEHFCVTRDFLNRYPAMLQTLLENDDA